MGIIIHANCFTMVLDTFAKPLKKKRPKLVESNGLYLEAMFMWIPPSPHQDWFAPNSIAETFAPFTIIGTFGHILNLFEPYQSNESKDRGN
jgi:hypothetical protein